MYFFRNAKVIFACIVFLLLSACASSYAKRYAEVSAEIAKLKATEGRICLYRNSFVGTAASPNVMLKNRVIATALPGAFFYIDRRPGNYEVATSIKVEKKLTVALSAGQEKFVRLGANFKSKETRVFPEFVDTKKLAVPPLTAGIFLLQAKNVSFRNRLLAFSKVAHSRRTSELAPRQQTARIVERQARAMRKAAVGKAQQVAGCRVLRRRESHA